MIEKFTKNQHAHKGRNAAIKLLAACGIMLGAGLMQSCEKDILSGQPSWLGNSIYERLQEGITTEDGAKRSFNYTLRLVDDLGQHDLFAQTGSMTIFAAPDDAYEAWFKEKGLTYDKLTPAQKKQLLYNSVISNAYLLELMANVSGNPPKEGLAMRRETRLNVLDSVPTMTPADMPAPNPLNNTRLDTWAKFRDNDKSIRIYKDMTAAPMIHFLKEFMINKNITNSDLAILTNHKSDNIEDSWINGKKVISSEQTCKNGYVYVVDGIIESNDNMAEIIRKGSDTKRWSQLLNRYSVPIPVKDAKALNDFRTQYNTQDSVYILRYFSERSADSKLDASVPLNQTPDGLVVDAKLTFDPGWNHYMYSNAQEYDMHYDAGAMIVPTDDVLDEWFASSPLQAEYETWEKVPPLTLSKLINVNMLPSFTESVPSKFGTVVDDAKMPLGIEPTDVVRCEMGCNGVVYVVNKVFAPSEYKSVMFPALIFQSRLGTIYHAIDSYDYGPYLNSVESKFSLLLPYNTLPGKYNEHDQQVMTYLDPCTYGLPRQVLYEFHWNTESATARLVGMKYEVNVDENGVVTKTSRTPQEASSDEVKNRLSDMINNLIIVGELSSSQEYYKTRAGSAIRYKDGKFITGFQDVVEKNTGITAEGYTPKETFNKNIKNGTTYCLDGEIHLTASQSVYQVLSKYPQYSKFLALMQDRSDRKTPTTDDIKTKKEKSELQKMLSASLSGKYTPTGEALKNYNILTFDNFNYTVYVPTNDALDAAHEAGLVPYWEDYDAAPATEKEEIARRILGFVRYHIQDNSLFIGGEPTANTNMGDMDKLTFTQYETAKMNYVYDPVKKLYQAKRYYSLYVKNDGNDIIVMGQHGDPCKVVKDSPVSYNNICREYWIEDKPEVKASTNVAETTSKLYSSSNAVVHQIDGVLLYDGKKWKDAVAEALAH